MKKHTKQRLLSLLLALLMVLTMAPTALLADGDDGEGGGDGSDGEETAVTVERMTLTEDNGQLEVVIADEEYNLILEPDTSSSGGVRIQTHLQPDVQATRKMHVVWRSTHPDVASVHEQPEDGQYGEGHVANIVGLTPGTATVTAKAGTVESTINVEVSGIRLSDELLKGIEIEENQTYDLILGTDYQLFGNADKTDSKISASEVNNKPNIYIRESTSKERVTIEGRQAGTAMVRLRLPAGGRVYEAEFPVTVTSSETVIEWKAGCSPSKPLKFSQLEEEIAKKCAEVTGGTLTSIIGLSVPTAEGILHLGYKSPEDTGAGVGGSVTYYAHTAARGPYISDITFVPKSTFTGEKATIVFTGNADNGRSFKGKILVTLTDEKSDLNLSTRRNTPVKLESGLFARSCQEAVGSPLDYVIFTLPPASQGTLYRDYKDEWDYAAKVSANERYNQKQLDTISFVPATGYVGEVRISYAGYSVSGSKYTGELVIRVKQGLDDAITYNDNGAGEVGFYRSDFDDFCENAIGRTLSDISFTLPPASQGTLYLNWNGIRGTAVASGSAYTPAQLDRMTFVAANGFDGVVRIPFSGTSRSGETITGTVEVHIQSSGAGRGDITYICAPGQSVKLVATDFANLCQSMTGQRLHYISFQSLPDFNQGALFHNRTSGGGMGARVNTVTKYFNGATPYIMNLSFWAEEQFRSVEIPFTGCSVSGQTFSGILAINSGAGAGSGSSGTVSYSVIGQNPVKFSGTDFDNACRQATNAALSYLRFDLPTSGQGILYYDYRSDANPTALNPGTILYRSGEVSVDRVSFVPARGFSGVAAVPFTGWAIDGRQFQGTVQISVQSAAALGGLVRYESWGEPVHINAYDIQTAAGGVPMSVRLTGLPGSSQGKIYYQYSGPTQYSWQGNTSTTYNLYGDPSVSNLTFVPKAGFYGTVEIPYTASNTDGTQSNGTIRVTVTEPYSSVNFDDLTGSSTQTRSAVDYLYAMGVVLGVGDRKYDPDASIRRGDFCVMLARAFRFNVGSSAQGFSDVPGDAYYAQAVNQMYALGVVNGVGNGRFAPSESVSRQDAALMVQRALAQAGIGVPDGSDAALAAYSDRSQVAGYAQGAVSGLAQLGIMPTSNGQLSPRTNLNRGDMALLLHRAMTQ